jgi:hypothetical protein
MPGTTNVRLLAGWLIAIALAWSSPARAWGDDGHEVIALIAERYLDPAVRGNVSALLAADPDSLTAPTIDAAATWADKFRDSDRNGARQQTRHWHFVDLEISTPDLDRACFGRIPLPSGTLASDGPAQDCIVDKLDQFAAELKSPTTNPSERIVALKFVLHLVGDLHQPLHASDDHDRGGNAKRASASGLKAATLHHYWDTEFVDQLGPSPARITASLLARISDSDVRAWSRGTPTDWEMESFRVAKDDAYGQLPVPNARGSYRLPDEYVAMATRDVAVQLSKAGVRLALMLNDTLGQGSGRR